MSESDVDANPPETVEVTIFNQTYRLRSTTAREQVQQAANLVDERMRRISSQITTHDVSKIAILAALNIADEMQNLRTYYEDEIQPLLARLSDTTGETATEEPTPGAPPSSKPQSWFDEFFDAPVETKSRAERLSTQVSAKLQSLRQSNPGTIEFTPEEGDA